MLGNVFLTFYRVTTRHPLYAALTLVGLGCGIAIFVIMALFVKYEISFESWIPGVDRIYEVQRSFFGTGDGFNRVSYQTPGGLLEDLQRDDSQLLGTRIWQNDLTVHVGGRSTRETEDLVDEDFFKVFDLEVVAGDTQTALQSPGNVVLTEEMANRYFGKDTALGKTLTLTDTGGTHDYLVSAILKTPPATTDMKFDFILLLTPQNSKFYRERGREDQWDNYHEHLLNTFLLLTSDRAAQLNSDFDHFVDVNAHKWADYHKTLRLRVNALQSVHLEGAKTTIWALGVVGMVAFIIAAINYINLATARAEMRAKEVAVRKSLGASRAVLRVQFLGEAVLATMLAAVIGLSIVELTLPLINFYGGLSLALDYHQEWSEISELAAAILAIGLLTGLYPAFLLSAFQPAMVLSSTRAPFGGFMAIRVREALIVLQFSVVIIFFIAMWGFVRQIQHMETADPGFIRDGLLMVTSTEDKNLSDSQHDSFLAALRAVPGIVSATMSEVAPGMGDMTSDWAILDGQDERRKGPEIGNTVILPDYFQTYGVKLLAGRLFDVAYAEDRFDFSMRMTNIIINESAAKALGFVSLEAALGRVINHGDKENKRRIIGVVADSRFYSPRKTIFPTLYYFLPNHSRWKQGGVASVRFAGTDEATIRARIEQVWHRIAPEVPFETVSAMDSLDKYYKPDRDLSHLFNIGAAVAALIGCIGLYGLAAFSTSQRSLEIGLRKVLGASRWEVLRLLLGQFLRPVLLANMIAAPIGYFILQTWLGQFDDRIAITPAPFLISTALAVAIAMSTVGMLAWRAAGIEPGRAIRYE